MASQMTFKELMVSAGGIKTKNERAARGVAPMSMKRRLLPNFDLLRSERWAMRGSLTASKSLDPKVSNPRIVSEKNIAP